MRTEARIASAACALAAELAQIFARELAQAGAAGDTASLLSFGLQLEAHVRLEERELFPLAEAILPVNVLAAVAAGALAKPRQHNPTTTGA